MPRSEAPGGRPAAFLDRDGTIIVEKTYLADPAGVELIPGAAPALRALADGGYALVLVTNQSGIARGLFGPRDYEATQRRLDELLAAAGVRLDGAYHCPHHPDFTGPCACRKPGTALHLRAARELGLDLAGSVFIGDRLDDVAPAERLGGCGILVRTGYGDTEARVPPGVAVAADLSEAADLVLAGKVAEKSRSGRLAPPAGEA
ncbi:MAG: HAD family hydrolase [Gemmatimonadetes bacterium]|nr:HAD family hydrolase [Gemmatimonadota bacterium]